MSQETDILIDLVRIKRECLVQLREMGRKQLELIEGGNITSLMDVLAAKQRPLTSLQRIERALTPFRSQDPEKRVWRSVEDRAKCSAQIQECETILAEIIAQERRSESTLILRRDEAAKQIHEIHLAGNTRHAYMPEPKKPVSRLDISTGK